jgi:AraC-like DNA-binding protein
VNDLAAKGLSPIEQQVIAEIRALRASPNKEMHTALIQDSAGILYHFIIASHGHVRLRLAPIAHELGADMRTLQRTFARKYGRSMLQCQLEARLNYSKYLLSIYPPEKIAAIAARLGYNEVRDFNHFFHRQVQQTPSGWMRSMHQHIADSNVVVIGNV